MRMCACTSVVRVCCMFGPMGFAFACRTCMCEFLCACVRAWMHMGIDVYVYACVLVRVYVMLACVWHARVYAFDVRHVMCIHVVHDCLDAMQVRVHACMCSILCFCVCMSVSMHACTGARTHIHIQMHVLKFMNVYIYIYIYIYMLYVHVCECR